MKKYKIGLYEKAMRSTLSWKEMLECTKDCGYDYMEISIDASEKRISRVYMSEQERKEIVDAMFETVSGFTTTGASILSDVEALSHCMLLWSRRSGSGDP